MVLTNNGQTSCSLTIAATDSAKITGLSLTSEASASEDVTVTIDRRNILNFVAPEDFNLLRTVYGEERMAVMELLSSWGLFPQIPVGTGQKIEVSGLLATDYLELTYDLGTNDEFSSTAPFGSNSDRYRLFQMISNDTAPAAAGDLALNQSDLATVYPSFPGGSNVGAGFQFDLLALYGCPVYQSVGVVNNQSTVSIKAVKNRRDIFDSDFRGLTYVASTTAIAGGVVYAAVGGRFQAGASGSPPRAIRFAEPITFDEGTELNVSCNIAQTGAIGLPAGSVKFGMVFDVIKK